MYRKIGVLIGGCLIAAVVMHAVLMAQDSDEPAELYTDDSEQEAQNDLLDIMGTAEEYGYLGVFIELLEDSELDKDLIGEGPFTLFAPDDSAFASLDAETLKRLAEDEKFRNDVLLLHIVKGKKVDLDFESESIRVRTLGGETLEITVNDEGAMVRDAWIIDGQLECSNGVIHVIDAVLFPQEDEPEDEDED